MQLGCKLPFPLHLGTKEKQVTNKTKALFF